MGLFRLLSRCARRASRPSRPGLVEVLETRALMSVSGVLTSVTAASGVVTVEATAGDDAFTLDYNANTNPATPNLVGTLVATDPSTGAVVGTAEVLRSDLAGYSVTGLVVNGGAGNDTITAGNTLISLTTSVTLNGGAGNDRLVGASNNYWDRLNGGDGNDYLSDANGVFSAYGGEGNDILDITFAAGWTKQPGSTTRRMDGRIQGNGGDDTIRLNAEAGSSSLFFSIKGDNVTDPTTDGSDTIIMLGNYTSGSVVNFDSSGNLNKAATNDRLYASKGGINTGGEPYTPIASLSDANALFDNAVATWQATR